MVAEIVNHIPSTQIAGQASEVHDESVQLPLAYPPVGTLGSSVTLTALHMLFDKQAYNEPQQVLLTELEQGAS